MAAYLLASALAATTLAVPSTQQLTFHSDVNATTVEAMIKSCDVRGKFGDGQRSSSGAVPADGYSSTEGDSLLVVYGDCSAASAGAISLGAINITAEYYVLLEYQVKKPHSLL